MNGTPSTAVATRNGTVSTASDAALAIKPGQTDWDKYQAAALAQIGLKDAPNADRAVFLHVCQRTGLDPFSRQIYMISRREKVPGTRDQYRDKWTIQTGIDGYRVNRARAERAAGVRGTLGRAVFYDWDGNEHKAWVRPEPPAACEITYTVRDADGTETPYTSVLRFDEYVQTRTDNGQQVASGQWATKPAHMLEKCTEADVYRKAFPQDFSGVYLDDAMSPADGAEVFPDRRQRVTGDMARERAQQRQQVQSEVIDTRPADVPPPPEPPAGEPQDGDPRAAVLAEFDRIGITSTEGQMEWVRALARTDATSLDGLARVQVEKLLPVLRRCQAVTDLDALLADGTVADA